MDEEESNKFPWLFWREKPSGEDEATNISKEWQWTELPSSFRQLLLRRHLGFCSKSSSTADSPNSDGQLPGPFQICKRNRYGIIKKVRCLACDTHFSTVICANATFCRKRIHDVQSLRPGDHIAWFRHVGYWHHAIFLKRVKIKSKENDSSKFGCLGGNRKTKATKERVKRKENDSSNLAGSSPTQNSNGNENENDPRLIDLSVIEYAEEKSKVVVKKSTVHWSRGFNMYRFHYEECYNPAYTIELAKATVTHFTKDTKDRYLEYDPLSDNCEHFARRCKTGKSESGQIRDCRNTCEMSFLRWMILLALALSQALVSHFVGHNQSSQNNTQNEAMISQKNETYYSTHNSLQTQNLVSIMMSSFLTLILLIQAITRALQEILVHRGHKRKRLDKGQQTDQQQDIDANQSKQESEGSNYQAKSKDNWKPSSERCKNFAWMIIRYILCRPVFECMPCITKYHRDDKPCCGEKGTKCNVLRAFCSNYFNVILRVVIREVFATGLALFIAFMYQVYWHVYILGKTETNNILQPFISFLILVGVSAVGLVIGHVVGTFIEKVLLSMIWCFRACWRRCKSNASTGTSINDQPTSSTGEQNNGCTDGPTTDHPPESVSLERGSVIYVC